MAYRDCKHGDPKPPDGWQVPTTANNCKNGYFGTAYWQAKLQQMVIPYRGTERLLPFLNIFTQIQNVMYITSRFTK